MTFGKRLIASLEEFLRDVESGNLVEQHTCSKMKVNGKIVYVRDRLIAPIKKRETIS